MEPLNDHKKIFSYGQFFYCKYDAKRAKDCSRAEGVLCVAKYGARLARNGGKPGFCVSKNALKI